LICKCLTFKSLPRRWRGFVMKSQPLPRVPKEPQWTAKGNPRRPKGAKRSPKSTQRRPKAPQRHQGKQREPNGVTGNPKSAQRRPKASQRHPRAQLDKQTPDQPPKRPLCYPYPFPYYLYKCVYMRFNAFLMNSNALQLDRDAL
jgi:hypothetical protein